MSNEKPSGDALFVEAKPAPKSSGGNSRGPSTAPKAKNVKKRWMYVGICLVIFFIAVSSWLKPTPPPPVPKVDNGTMVNTTPKGLDQKTWEAQSQADIRGLQAENDKLKAAQAAQQAEIDKNKALAALPQGIVAPPNANNSNTSSHSNVVPPPPVNQDLGSMPQAGLPKSVNNGLKNGSDGNSGLPAIPPPFTRSADVPVEPMVFSPDKALSKPTGASGELATKVNYKRNPQTGLMVAGAFAPVVLLNGIDAGTSSGSRSNPLPVLIRVQDNAVLPGSSKYIMKSCFLLASGYGDLSAERVYIRLARLSCVDKGDRLVLSVPVQGYVVDSDNTLGMRGKVVDRQGARLGKAMLAGFAQGLSTALGGSEGTVTSSALGAATSITGPEALRASGLSGISSATSQLAQFYLKEAEAIFPVIEVDGGRTASVVFTEDAQLEWGNVDEQFVRTEEPTNK